MSLYNDAAPHAIPLITENELSKNDLKKIEDSLDIQEKISVLFLMTNNYTCTFQEIYRLLRKHEKQKNYILNEFIDNNENNWRNKLLEVLCVIQNRQIIRELGILYQDLESFYLPRNKHWSRNINPIAKCLYLLCEELTQEENILLLQYVKRDFSKYIESLKDTESLELHMLYWMQEKYISIQLDDKVDLKKLLRHMKRFNNTTAIYTALERYESTEKALVYKHINSSRSQSTTKHFSRSNEREESMKKLKKGRCIIISQMSFLGEKYETRFGTLADCTKLSETFKGFGFVVDIFRDLKKHEILETLENISKTFELDDECLFLCILSHGYKGGIVSSDEQDVSLEEFEHKICCDRLKDVIKIVIIQACQGTTTGQATETLTTDGPTNGNVSNILAYRNFCIFISTIPGFVSVRHKHEGSWFIQELCDVFQTEGSKITFLEATSKIIQRVMEKRGKLNGTNFVAQLPELRPYRLLTNFMLPEYKKEK